MAIGAALVLVVLAVGYAFWATGTETPATTNQAYFTVDDGNTWFLDDATKVAPFDKDGKQAVKAVLYESADGKRQFVAFLQRMSPQAMTEIKQYQSGKATPDSMAQMRLSESVELKRPGEVKWLPRDTFNRTFKLADPSGGLGTPKPVVP